MHEFNSCVRVNLLTRKNILFIRAFVAKKNVSEKIE
jgi:hypothetical protein